MVKYVIGKNLKTSENNRLASIQKPTWANPFTFILLVQPSSAAAERVFCFYRTLYFSHVQRSSQEYISVSVVLQYNRNDISSVFQNNFSRIIG